MKSFEHSCEKHVILDQFGSDPREKWRFKFSNGYGASVIQRIGGVLYKIAIIGKNGCLDFDSIILSREPDLIGTSSIFVTHVLDKISKL